MRKVHTFLAAAMLAVSVSVSGCANSDFLQKTQTVVQKIKDYWNKDSQVTVYELRSGYAIALGAAAKFKTTMCPSVTSHTYCPTLIPKLRTLNHQALSALDEAETFVRQHPTLDATAVIAAAQAAILAFAQLEADNGITPATN